MFKKQIQKLWNNHLVKNVLVIASGTAGAQVIGMAFIPIITRTYGPQVYGILGAFIALSGILNTLTALAYPLAIVLPEKDSTAKALVKLSILLAASTSCIVLVILWLSDEWITLKLDINSLSGFIYFVPAVMFLTACQVTAEHWLIRKKSFKGIANITIAHSIINYGSQAVIGLYTPLAVILLSIHTLSIGIRAIFLGYFGKIIISNNDKKEPYSLKETAYEYRDFPLYRAPQGILNAVSQSMPVLMFTVFFEPATAGFYTLTRTVLGLPIALIGSSVQSVFYPHFNETVLKKRLSLPLLIKATATLAAIGIFPFLIVILFGPFLFEFVFGEEWSTAGKYAQWLSVWLFFGLVNGPSASAIAIFRMQRWFLGYEIASIVLRAIAIYVGFVYFSSALVTVAIFSIVGAVLNIYLISRMFFIAKKIDQFNHKK